MSKRAPMMEDILHYGAAAALVVVAAALRWSLPQYLYNTPYLVFYPAVVAAAAFGGFGPGIFTTIVSALCVDLLFDTSPWRIDFREVENMGRMVIFLAGGLGTSAIAARAARQLTVAKQAEQALRLNEQALQTANRELQLERERWQSMVEGIAEEVWVSDSEGRMSLVNIAPATSMKLLPFRDRTMERILEDVEINADGVPRPIQEAPLLRSLSGGVVRGEEIMRHRTTGITRWRHYSSAPMRNAAGQITGAVAIVRDVTETKQMEHELEAARRAAEQASRAKDHFIAVLSHELRTPLTPVLVTASMLEQDEGLNEDTRGLLEVIRRNAELEARLIDDLLDVTRITHGKVELDKRPVALCDVLRRTVEVCQPDIDARRLHFGMEIVEPPIMVDGDAARLQQAFWNLLKNAVKFTPHGGCVAMRSWRENAQVLVQVTDSGEGIAPDAILRIFNAFEQSERAVTRRFGGLGLGLTITKSIVELHGGTISAHSDGVGKGSTFTVRLPLLSPTAPQPAASVGQAPAKPARALRILLVEDHGDTAQSMVRLLRRAGHDAVAAGDFATALEQVSGSSFDLLISDLGLPDGSGIDLLRELRRQGKRLPAIALSGYGQDEDIRRSRDAGFMTHLVQPATSDQLANAIALATGGAVAGRR